MRRFAGVTHLEWMLPMALLPNPNVKTKVSDSSQKHSISGYPGAFRCTSGFSLIEVLVVIVVIGILLAIASPYYQTWISEYRIREESNLIYSQLSQARAEAIQKNVPVVCSLTAGSGAARILVFVDNTAPANFVLDAGDQVLFDHGLESGQTLSNITFPSSETAFGFDGRGMSLDGRAGSFEISGGGQTYTISINLVGLVSMQS